MRPERFRAKWIPVRAKKTRQNKNPEPRSDSIGTEKSLDHDEFRLRRRTTSPSPRKRGEPNVHVDSTQNHHASSGLDRWQVGHLRHLANLARHVGFVPELEMTRLGRQVRSQSRRTAR
jgi:hypothetical protein